MDAQAVRKCVLMDNLAKPSVTARKFAEAKPDRFVNGSRARAAQARLRARSRCAGRPEPSNYNKVCRSLKMGTFFGSLFQRTSRTSFSQFPFQEKR